jgi:HSP20 family protein
MPNIVRQSVFADPLDDFFRGFFVRPLAFENTNLPQFRMDVGESENAYRVKADLPGVKKEDITVTVEGDTVTVTAQVRSEKETRDGERVVRAERHTGKIARSFSLGQEVDEDNAQAHLVDGVLDLVLPKKAAAQRKRLTIN